MPLILSESTASDPDFERFFELVSTAFTDEHPYINVVFPAHESAIGRKDGATRLRDISKADPCAHFMKVTDTEHPSGRPKIIALAKWNVYDDTIPEEVELDGPWWDEGKGDKAYAKELFRAYLEPRRKAIRDSRGNLVSLDLMVVDPDEQRRGAGKLCMEWGVKKADELKVEAVVESSRQGRGLYEQYGFKIIKTYELEMPEPWKAERKQVFHWMVRPRPA